jgi:hypothetical protein
MNIVEFNSRPYLDKDYFIFTVTELFISADDAAQCKVNLSDSTFHS